MSEVLKRFRFLARVYERFAVCKKSRQIHLARFGSLPGGQWGKWCRGWMVSEYVHQVRRPGLITITPSPSLAPVSQPQTTRTWGLRAWPAPASNYAFKCANIKFADNRVIPKNGLCYNDNLGLDFMLHKKRLDLLKPPKLHWLSLFIMLFVILR